MGNQFWIDVLQTFAILMLAISGFLNSQAIINNAKAIIENSKTLMRVYRLYKGESQ